MAATSPREPKHIVIVGGGIIGSTSAYFLSHHPSFDPTRDSITILEATKIAGGASGKAGGLLALWAYPSCIVPLSYRLHKELAEKHGGKERWGYRGVGCGSIECRGRPVPANASVRGKEDKPTGESDGGALNGESVSLKKRSKEAMALLEKAGVPKDLDWVDPRSVVDYGSMGTPDTTAQVHPYMFTTSMAKLAEEKGVKMVTGCAFKVSQPSGKQEVDGVIYTDGPYCGIASGLRATHVVLAAGPWTQMIWDEVPISATRAHSVTIRPTRPVSAYALFTQIELPKNFTAARSSVAKKRSKGPAQIVSPEIYARPNNEVYACGEGDHLIPLPDTTDLVKVDDRRCQDIVDYVGSISDELRDGEVTARQACYLPSVTTGGGPIIGESSTIKGLIVAAGHTCWGIQNAPATGKLVSEIIWEGAAKSADIKSLNPKRFGL